MQKIVILAAGKGRRMGSDLPKVLVPINGRPMIEYLLDAVVSSGVDSRPIIVVSPDSQDLIANSLKHYNLQYVIQAEQLGTGHAVQSAEDHLEESVDRIVVLYGDHPFITSESIKKLGLDKNNLTLMPTVLPDFTSWRQNFYHWGRIILSDAGLVERIVEFRDASEEEKLVTRVFPGLMAFNRVWLFENINKLRNENNQQEYYLTDMVKLAFLDKQTIGSIEIDAREAMGINSQAELDVAVNLFNLEKSNDNN